MIKKFEKRKKYLNLSKIQNFESQKKFLKNFKSENMSSDFLKYLVRTGAFSGKFSRITHFSQESVFKGIRNYNSFYEIEKSLSLFSIALKFLNKAKLNKKTRFVIVGNPPLLENEIISFFRRQNICFFSNDNWPVGFFSKNSKSQVTKNSILIVYMPEKESLAYNEALYCNIPVVGFASYKCDIRSIDYPVLHDLEKLGFNIFRFLTCFLK